MYIKVKKYENKETKGKAYTYNCDLLVNIGDLVIAEFGKSEAVLQVVEIDVEKPDFACKDIIEKYSDDEEEPSELALIVKGLEINSIDQLPKMKVNVEDVKKRLDAALPDTKKLIITPDNYKDCKAIAKNLKKVAKDFDEQRKAPKRIFKALNEPYEAAMQEIIAYIKTKETDITDITDEYDRKVSEGNIEYAKGEIEKAIAEFKLAPPFDEIELRPSYENLTATKKSITQDIREQAQTLALQQNDFTNKKVSVKFAVEQANKNLVNKVNADIYNGLIVENAKNMGDITELLGRVQMDLDEKAEFERKVAEKQKAEAEARARAEAERILAEEREKIAAEEREKIAAEERARIEKEEPKDVVFDEDETPFATADETPFTPFNVEEENKNLEEENCTLYLVGKKTDIDGLLDVVRDYFPDLKVMVI